MYVSDIVRVTELSTLAIPEVTLRRRSGRGVIYTFDSIGADILLILTVVRFTGLGAINMTIFNQVVVCVTCFVLGFLRVVWVGALFIFLCTDVFVLLIMHLFPLLSLPSRCAIDVLNIHTIAQILFSLVLRACAFDIRDVNAITKEPIRKIFRSTTIDVFDIHAVAKVAIVVFCSGSMNVFNAVAVTYEFGY